MEGLKFVGWWRNRERIGRSYWQNKLRTEEGVVSSWDRVDKAELSSWELSVVVEVMQGQHDRRVMVVGGRRRYTKVNMIAGRWSGVRQHDRRSMKRRSPYACRRWSPKLYKVNMIAGRWNGDLHACVVGGRRSCQPDRRSMKRRSPCERSRWSPKVCKGQPDRRLMKRRSPFYMIADRWSGVLSTRSSVEEAAIFMWVVSDRRSNAMCMGKSSLGEVNVGGLG